MRIWNVFMAYDNEHGNYSIFDWYCRNKKEAMKKRTWINRVTKDRLVTHELSIEPIEIPRNKDGVIKMLNNDR